MSGLDRLHTLRAENDAAGQEMQREGARFRRIAGAAPTRAVSADNLFQTPETVAARMAGMIGDRRRILEPSAGLGRIYRAIRDRLPHAAVSLVEVSPDCCAELYRETERDRDARLVQADFLACDLDRLGGERFNAVVMNPPFRRGSDIKHIRHAVGMLAHGGVLVSLCADGPRQRNHLRPIADTWQPLPPGTFRSEGTNVNAAIMTITA